MSGGNSRPMSGGYQGNNLSLSRPQVGNYSAVSPNNINQGARPMSGGTGRPMSGGYQGNNLSLSRPQVGNYSAVSPGNINQGERPMSGGTGRPMSGGYSENNFSINGSGYNIQSSNQSRGYSQGHQGQGRQGNDQFTGHQGSGRIGVGRESGNHSGGRQNNAHQDRSSPVATVGQLRLFFLLFSTWHVPALNQHESVLQHL